MTGILSQVVESEGVPENPAAFPFAGERDAYGCGIRESSPGMSLRDWFAGQALIGLCTTLSGTTVPKYDKLVRDAFAFADAMLAARKVTDNA